MCGICGFTGEAGPRILEDMAEAIRHRGPDSGGFYSVAGEIHLGARRLRVLDTETGDQPIFNEDESIVVVYNGEIYNHAQLRAQLEQRGHKFSTGTDTEVLVHLYEEKGLDFLKALNGMFAFALWDNNKRRLVLARDPVGVKPLIYTKVNGCLIFASEAKSLLRHPLVTAELDANALHQLLNVRFVPAPATLFRGLKQLAPGHAMVLENGTSTVHNFHQWSFPGTADLTLEEAGAEFDHQLRRCVERQMDSDVPLGVFLSGGLDSSAILRAVSQSSRFVSPATFSLGFNEPTDELDDARLMAQTCGSQHHEMTLDVGALECFPRIVYHAEMPKVNSTQGYYLSRFAREHVTVALSGLGGDELFFGYDLYRYLWPARMLIDSPLAPATTLLGPLFDAAASWLHKTSGQGTEAPRRVLELAASGKDPVRFYTTLRNGWDLRSGAKRAIYTERWLRRVEESTRTSFAGLFDRPELPFAEQVQWAEFRGKMVDDFLLNEDRMSMANSLEVRVPFLDHKMVDFAFTLPFRVKHAAGQQKPVMKAALAHKLPRRILNKKKWGFTFDSYEQYKKNLRSLCQRELSRGFIEEQGIFRYEFVQGILEARPSSKMRWHYFMLWQLLGLKFWQEIFVEGRPFQEIEARIRSSAAGA